MKHIYTSVDIGSNMIKVIVLELFNNKLNLLATSSVKSHGIKQGLITDVEQAKISLKKAFNEINEMLGIEIKKVIANVPSYNANFAMVNGQVPIEDNVDSKTITSVLQDAARKNLKKNMEVITVLPIDFMVDDNKAVKDPKGLEGQVLKVRGVMVSTPDKNVLSVISLIESLGIEVVDISLSCLGDINAFKTKQMTKQVGAVINIGYETTTVSVCNKGIPINNSIIGLGGKSIDNDLAYMYKINTNEAEHIKEKFAVADAYYATNYEKYETVNNSGETVEISQKETSDVVMSRLIELLTLAKKEIKSLTNNQIDYIIVTGGTSNMRHFDKVVDKEFNNLATVGSIKIVGLRNNKYSVTLGNIVYFINKLKLKGLDYSMMDEEEVEDLSAVRKGFDVPNDSMIGKVFGYFFGE